MTEDVEENVYNITVNTYTNFICFTIVPFGENPIPVQRPIDLETILKSTN